VRRFLACCSDDAKGELTTVEMEYGDETFYTNGLLVLQRNYLDVYPYDKWESSQQLPNFVLYETFEPTEANIVDGETSAPGYLTEPELISLMDANGIGTDATMAEHIAKIKERQYVQTRAGANTATRGGVTNRSRGSGRGNRGGRGGAARGGSNTNDSGSGPSGSVQQFIPTTLGVALIEGYDGMGLETSLGKPFLRKEMELKMRAICAGTKTRGEFVHETLEQYRDVFVRSTQQVDVLKAVSSAFLPFSILCPFKGCLWVDQVLINNFPPGVGFTY
jgi:DNA topoisomerase III